MRIPYELIDFKFTINISKNIKNIIEKNEIVKNTSWLTWIDKYQKLIGRCLVYGGTSKSLRK